MAAHALQETRQASFIKFVYSDDGRHYQGPEHMSHAEKLRLETLIRRRVVKIFNRRKAENRRGAAHNLPEVLERITKRARRDLWPYIDYSQPGVIQDSRNPYRPSSDFDNPPGALYVTYRNGQLLPGCGRGVGGVPKTGVVTEAMADRILRIPQKRGAYYDYHQDNGVRWCAMLSCASEDDGSVGTVKEVTYRQACYYLEVAVPLIRDQWEHLGNCTMRVRCIRSDGQRRSLETFSDESFMAACVHNAAVLLAMSPARVDRMLAERGEDAMRVLVTDCVRRRPVMTHVPEFARFEQYVLLGELTRMLGLHLLKPELFRKIAWTGLDLASTCVPWTLCDGALRKHLISRYLAETPMSVTALADEDQTEPRLVAALAAFQASDAEDVFYNNPTRYLRQSGRQPWFGNFTAELFVRWLEAGLVRKPPRGVPDELWCQEVDGDMVQMHYARWFDMSPHFCRDDRYIGRLRTRINPAVYRNVTRADLRALLNASNRSLRWTKGYWRDSEMEWGDSKMDWRDSKMESGMYPSYFKMHLSDSQSRWTACEWGGTATAHLAEGSNVTAGLEHVGYSDRDFGHVVPEALRTVEFVYTVIARRGSLSVIPAGMRTQGMYQDVFWLNVEAFTFLEEPTMEQILTYAMHGRRVYKVLKRWRRDPTVLEICIERGMDVLGARREDMAFENMLPKMQERQLRYETREQLYRAYLTRPLDVPYVDTLEFYTEPMLLSVIRRICHVKPLERLRERVMAETLAADVRVETLKAALDQEVDRLNQRSEALSPSCYDDYDSDCYMGESMAKSQVASELGN